MVEINTESSGSAAEGINEGFGGTAGAMRNILDSIFAIDQAFSDFIRFLQGTFLGWDNVELIFGVLLP